MLTSLKNIVDKLNQNDLNSYLKIVEKINRLEEEYSKLTDESTSKSAAFAKMKKSPLLSLVVLCSLTKLIIFTPSIVPDATTIFPWIIFSTVAWPKVNWKSNSNNGTANLSIIKFSI